METEVARKIENSIATLQDVKHIYTKVQDGTATITVEFRLEKPMQEALDDVRDAVARVRSDLPGDLRDPQVTKVDLSGMPILTYTVASEPHGRRGPVLVRRQQRHQGHARRARRRRGGARGRRRRARCASSSTRCKLQALNATAADISRQLRQVQQEASGGRTDLGGAEQSVRTIATVQLGRGAGAAWRSRWPTAAASAWTRWPRCRTPWPSSARPRCSTASRWSASRSRAAAAPARWRWPQACAPRWQKLQAAHPDITVTEAFNFVDPVQEDYDGSMLLLYEGALLAVLVVWLFLRDWRATLVAATALPLSVIPTFAAMHLFGFTLNVVTLLALSLVVGILVDDAIVEIENIMRHLRMGKTPYQAAMEAADEIGLAVIATTFTLIAVFLPTAFMSGVPGKFFVQFGWTAAIAVFFSLVVARMLTPMMAAYLLRKPHQGSTTSRAGWRVYLRWARWCLKHRIKTTLAARGLSVGSLMLVPLLPTGFIPPDDLSQTQVTISLPPGSTFAQTLAAAEQARELVQKNPHVKLVYTAIGGGSAGGDPFAPQGAAEVRKATLTINMTPRQRARRPEQAGHRGAAARGAGGAARRARQGRLRRLVGEVRAGAGRRGRPRAGRHARLVERELRTIPGIGNVTSTSSLVRPELIVRPDFAAPPTWASPPPPSPTRCASPPPATTTRAWPSSTCRSARCRWWSSSRPTRAPTWSCCRAWRCPARAGR